MKAALSLLKSELYYFVEGRKINGFPPGLYGGVSGLYGGVSGLRGDVSGLYGDVSGLRGNVSGLYGDVSDCEITVAERLVGIDIKCLVREKENVQ